jgi:hypothetical protein
MAVQDPKIVHAIHVCATDSIVNVLHQATNQSLEVIKAFKVSHLLSPTSPNIPLHQFLVVKNYSNGIHGQMEGETSLEAFQQYDEDQDHHKAMRTICRLSGLSRTPDLVTALLDHAKSCGLFVDEANVPAGMRHLQEMQDGPVNSATAKVDGYRICHMYKRLATQLKSREEERQQLAMQHLLKEYGRCVVA